MIEGLFLITIKTWLALLLVCFIAFFWQSLFKAKNESKPYPFALSLIVSLFGLVSSIAIVKTNGNSIFSFFPILVLYYLYVKRKEVFFRPSNSLLFLKKNTGQILFLFGIVFLIVVYQYSKVYFFENRDINLLNPDYHFYSRLSEYMYAFGIESMPPEYFLDKSAINLEPYHYGEVWLSALLTKVFKVNSVDSVFIAMPAIVYGLVAFIALQIVRQIKTIRKVKHSFIDYFIASLVLFSVAVSVIYPNVGILKTDLWSVPALSMTKLCFIYLVLSYTFLALLEKDNDSFVLPVSLLLMAYTAVGPQICVAIFLLFIFKTKSIFKTLLKLTPLIISSIWILVFYYLNHHSSSDIGTNDSYAFDLNYVKTSVNIIGKTSLQMLFVLLPYLGLLYFIKESKKYFQIILFTLFGVFVGLLVWAIVFPMHDSVQLWAVFYLPASNLLCFILFSIIFIQQQKIVPKLLLLVLLLANYLTYSTYETVSPNMSGLNKIPEQLYNKGVFWRETEEYVGTFSELEQVYLGGTTTLQWLVPNLQLTCISIENIPSETYNKREFISKTTFYKYKNLYPKEEDVSLKIRFIKEFDVQYALIKKQETVPLRFLELFTKTEMKVDGYTIYLRKEEESIS